MLRRRRVIVVGRVRDAGIAGEIGLGVVMVGPGVQVRRAVPGVLGVLGVPGVSGEGRRGGRQDVRRVGVRPDVESRPEGLEHDGQDADHGRDARSAEGRAVCGASRGHGGS